MFTAILRMPLIAIAGVTILGIHIFLSHLRNPSSNSASSFISVSMLCLFPYSDGISIRSKGIGIEGENL